MSVSCWFRIVFTGFYTRKTVVFIDLEGYLGESISSNLAFCPKCVAIIVGLLCSMRTSLLSSCNSDTKSYDYAKLAIKFYATVLVGWVENRPSLEYDDPMRMPKLHALPVLQRKDSLAQAPPKILIDFFCICMNYTLCVPHFCVKVKRWWNKTKKRWSITERGKTRWIQIINISCLFFLVANYWK